MANNNKARVLIIDDEEIVRESLVHYLQDGGYGVLQAESGRVALDMLKETEPDIILCNLVMGQMNGLEVLAEVSRQYPMLPIVIVTDAGIIQNAIESLRLGAWDFILKPIGEMEILFHTIDKCLERAKLIRENKRYREHLEEEISNRTAELEAANINLGKEIDIRKRAESELARHRDHLQELVMEKTEQLEAAHRELLRKERLAAMGRLMATVSHEIRNPLGTISSSLFTIRRRARDKDLNVERVLERSDRAIKRCVMIIDDLHDYARSFEPALERVSIRDFIDFMLAEYAFPPEIEIVKNLNEDGQVDLDPDRIRGCLVRIFDNAIHAMNEGEGGEKRLTTEIRTSESRVEVIISDTGMGMRPEELGKIFEPLYSTKNFGIGLGLPIVVGIMEKHAGGVEIDSVYANGTTVTLWLPRAKSSGDD